MNQSGFAFVGALTVDHIKSIERLPVRSELVRIHSHISATGGICNSAPDMAKLDPTVPIHVYGRIGCDADGDLILSTLTQYGIDTSGLLRSGMTSYTDVYEERRRNTRTFFHFGGANSHLDVEDVDFSRVTARYFHAAYPLLLDTLDQPDEVYGTRMARLLHKAQLHGCLTSLDVVTEQSERVPRIVLPSLKYTDYLIINELEAEAITGICLTDEHQQLMASRVPDALGRLKDAGVSRWVVIHAPSGAYGLDENNHLSHEPGKCLPEGFIRGTVGAGDAFCSGVLLAAYRSLSLDEALRCGNASAVASLRSETASGSMETMEQALVQYNALPYRS